MLAGGHQNVCVVGDTDQCLPPGSMVSTPSGSVPIEQVEVGDVVMGAAGASAAHRGTVVHVHEGRYDGHMVKITAAGRTISATPHHLVPARLVPQADTWLVYLMYRADRGWRIGRTIGDTDAGVDHVWSGTEVDDAECAVASADDVARLSGSRPERTSSADGRGDSALRRQVAALRSGVARRVSPRPSRRDAPLST